MLDTQYLCCKSSLYFNFKLKLLIVPEKIIEVAELASVASNNVEHEPSRR